MPKEYGQKLKEYEEKILEYLKEFTPLNPEILEDLERFRVYLSISPEHAKEIETRLMSGIDSEVDKVLVEAPVPKKQSKEEELKDFYSKLEDLLREKQWRAADSLTLTVMLIASGDYYPYVALSTSKVEKISCTDMRIVDELWVKYSNGHFGFSVQNEIWQEVKKDESAFYLHVGWKFKEQKNLLWRKYEEEVFVKDATFSLQAPKGHLPWLNTEYGGKNYPTFYNYSSGPALMSRITDCNIKPNLSGKSE